MSLDSGAFPQHPRSVIRTGLSKREYAAIHLGIPMSGNEELDNMIRKAIEIGHCNLRETMKSVLPNQSNN